MNNVTDSINEQLVKGCFGHWELGSRKLLFGGHSSKSLHCSVYPNAQCSVANSQCPKQPLLNKLYNVINKERKKERKKERRKKKNTKDNVQQSISELPQALRRVHVHLTQWVGIIAIKTERTQIHFLCDVLVTVASLDLKVPNSSIARSQ